MRVLFIDSENDGRAVEAECLTEDQLASVEGGDSLLFRFHDDRFERAVVDAEEEESEGDEEGEVTYDISSWIPV